MHAAPAGGAPTHGCAIAAGHEPATLWGVPEESTVTPTEGRAVGRGASTQVTAGSGGAGRVAGAPKQSPESTKRLETIPLDAVTSTSRSMMTLEEDARVATSEAPTSAAL